MGVSGFGKKGTLVFLLFILAHGSLTAADVILQRGVTPVALPKDGIYQDSWAVLIGINRYKQAPRLNYAVSDAKSVLATLKQLGFSEDKIIVLLDEEATKQRIEQVLYGVLRATQRDDRVFVYFAGHGITVTLPRGGEEGYILPIDGDPANPALTAISMDDVRRISRWVPAKHILFSVDACYSGFAITRDVPPTRVDAVYLEAMTKEPAVQIITAGRKGEPVLEEEGHGLFTRRLLQGLGGLADSDQNGIITGQELATWLESRVIRDSQNRQHPQYARLSGEGQFVFVVPGRSGEGRTVAVNPIDDERKRLESEAERIRLEQRLLEQQRKLQAEREQLLAEREKFEEEKRKAELARLELERLRSRATSETAANLAPLRQPPNSGRSDSKAIESQIANVRNPPTPIQSSPKPVALMVQSQKNELELNEKARLTVLAKFSDGENSQILEGVRWFISDNSLASISPTGDVRAIKEGEVTVVAQLGDLRSPPLTIVLKSVPKVEPHEKKGLSEKIHKLLGSAKIHRDQGEYLKALATLRKAKHIEPTAKEIDEAIEQTQKACKAEQQLGLATSC